MATIKRIKPKENGTTKVIFLCRLSYCHLDAPWSGTPGNEPKYSVSCIIPKDDVETVAAVKAAIARAYEEGVTKVWKGARPPMQSSNFKYPLKDGDLDRPDDEAYRGAFFLSASSKTEVPVLNRLKEPIKPTDAYSGCWALVSVNFFAFKQGVCGVGGGLNAVLKYADDEKLGGIGNAAADFNEFDLGEDVGLDNL